MTNDQRYKLVAYQTEIVGSFPLVKPTRPPKPTTMTEGSLVLLDPAGKMVMDVVFFSGGFGNGALPGLEKPLPNQKTSTSLPEGLNLHAIYPIKNPSKPLQIPGFQDGMMVTNRIGTSSRFFIELAAPEASDTPKGKPHAHRLGIHPDGIVDNKKALNKDPKQEEKFTHTKLVYGNNGTNGSLGIAVEDAKKFETVMSKIPLAQWPKELIVIAPPAKSFEKPAASLVIPHPTPPISRQQVAAAKIDAHLSGEKWNGNNLKALLKSHFTAAQIQNLHDTLGIESGSEGYGTVIGNQTAQRFREWAKEHYKDKTVPASPVDAIKEFKKELGKAPSPRASLTDDNPYSALLEGFSAPAGVAPAASRTLAIVTAQADTATGRGA